MADTFGHWSKISLSSAGRPVYGEGETEIMFQGRVGLCDGDVPLGYEEGTVYLTSHRIMFLADSKQGRNAIALPLADVSMVEYSKKYFRQSPRVTIYFKPPRSGSARLSFRGANHVEFFDLTQKALATAEWAREKPSISLGGQSRQREAVHQFDPTRAGIAGIQRAKAEELHETDKELKEAFDDVDSLMAKAKDMVNLAQRLQAKLSKQTDESDENAKFKNYLLSLGVLTPVTKDVSGTSHQYFRDLARELADFLLKPLEDYGGYMALADVYCLYNRARGTELISPGDLLHACQLFERLQLPVRLYTCASGLRLIQLVSLDDETVAHAMAQLFQCDQAMLGTDCITLTPEEYATKRTLPVSIAKDHLLIGERCGVLCRDDSVEGVRFYPNLLLKLAVN